MKILFYPLILGSFGCYPTIKVYICTSKTATKYHFNKDCRGLKNCNYQIKATTLEEAKKQGKRLCGWEHQE